MLHPNFFHTNKVLLLPCFLWWRRFWPCIFFQMLYPFKAKRLATIFAHGLYYRRTSLVYFKTSSRGFIRPWNKHKQLDCKINSCFFLLLTHSERWSLKKGYFVQSFAIFWLTFVITSKNNKRIRCSVKKGSFLFLIMVETLRWRHKVK